MIKKLPSNNNFLNPKVKYSFDELVLESTRLDLEILDLEEQNTRIIEGYNKVKELFARCGPNTLTSEDKDFITYYGLTDSREAAPSGKKDPAGFTRVINKIKEDRIKNFESAIISVMYDNKGVFQDKVAEIRESLIEKSLYDDNLANVNYLDDKREEFINALLNNIATPEQRSEVRKIVQEKEVVVKSEDELEDELIYDEIEPKVNDNIAKSYMLLQDNNNKIFNKRHERDCLYNIATSNLVNDEDFLKRIQMLYDHDIAKLLSSFNEDTKFEKLKCYSEQSILGHDPYMLLLEIARVIEFFKAKNQGKSVDGIEKLAPNVMKVMGRSYAKRGFMKHMCNDLLYDTTEPKVKPMKMKDLLSNLTVLFADKAQIVRAISFLNAAIISSNQDDNEKADEYNKKNEENEKEIANNTSRVDKITPHTLDYNIKVSTAISLLKLIIEELKSILYTVTDLIESLKRNSTITAESLSDKVDFLIETSTMKDALYGDNNKFNVEHLINRRLLKAHQASSTESNNTVMSVEDAKLKNYVAINFLKATKQYLRTYNYYIRHIEKLIGDEWALSKTLFIEKEYVNMINKLNKHEKEFKDKFVEKIKASSLETVFKDTPLNTITEMDHSIDLLHELYDTSLYSKNKAGFDLKVAEINTKYDRSGQMSIADIAANIVSKNLFGSTSGLTCIKTFSYYNLLTSLKGFVSIEFNKSFKNTLSKIDFEKLIKFNRDLTQQSNSVSKRLNTENISNDELNMWFAFIEVHYNILEILKKSIEDYVVINRTMLPIFSEVLKSM